MFVAYRGQGRYFRFPLVAGVLALGTFAWGVEHPVTCYALGGCSVWNDGLSLPAMILFLLAGGSLGILLVSLRRPTAPSRG